MSTPRLFDLNGGPHRLVSGCAQQPLPFADPRAPAGDKLNLKESCRFLQHIVLSQTYSCLAYIANENGCILKKNSLSGDSIRSGCFQKKTQSALPDQNGALTTGPHCFHLHFDQQGHGSLAALALLMSKKALGRTRLWSSRAWSGRFYHYQSPLWELRQVGHVFLDIHSGSSSAVESFNTNTSLNQRRMHELNFCMVVLVGQRAPSSTHWPRGKQRLDAGFIFISKDAKHMS